MTESLDLRQLAVRRDPRPPPGPGRTPVLSRYVLPALLLAGFAVLAGFAARQSWDRPHPVTVVPVLAGRAEGREAADTPLFQAAGWVEPRPTPTLVPALAEGVVEQLLVVEGQDVKAGDAVAHLVAADAELAERSAAAELHLREAELDSAKAAVAAAKERLARPIHLQTDLAEAEAALARLETEQANLPNLFRAADARLKAARLDLEAKKRVANDLPAGTLLRVEAEYDAAVGAVEELRTREKRLPAEVGALARKRDALRQRLERKTDEVRQLAEAEASERAAAARKRQAEVAAEVAKLKRERMTVRAPSGGRVLGLIARPGARLGGGVNEPTTVVTLYDPTRLQIRVDVRLDDVARVSVGQQVQVRSAAVSGRALAGEVLALTGQADVQKNTLGVKVSVSDPPPELRPDMLAQVTFLAPPRADPSPSGEGSPMRLMVPRQLVDSSGRVWVADRAVGVARLKAVELGLPAGDLVEVVSGLDAADKLIAGGREGLTDGRRINVTGEDDSLGLARAGGR